MAEFFHITVREQRPGWHASVVFVDGSGTQGHEATGGTVHAAVTKALAEAGLVCSYHLGVAREKCPYA